MNACSLSVNKGQSLTAGTRWAHESYVANFSGTSCIPMWKTCQQRLVEDCGKATTWELSVRAVLGVQEESEEVRCFHELPRRSGTQ